MGGERTYVRTDGRTDAQSNYLDNENHCLHATADIRRESCPLAPAKTNLEAANWQATRRGWLCFANGHWWCSLDTARLRPIVTLGIQARKRLVNIFISHAAVTRSDRFLSEIHSSLQSLMLSIWILFTDQLCTMIDAQRVYLIYKMHSNVNHTQARSREQSFIQSPANSSAWPIKNRFL